MTDNEYLKLQIGMYVTDREAKEAKDFCTIQQFDRMGRMKLQPLDNKGMPNGEAYWIHYRDYDLQDKLLSSSYDEIYFFT